MRRGRQIAFLCLLSICLSCAAGLAVAQPERELGDVRSLNIGSLRLSRVCIVILNSIQIPLRVIS